MNEEKLSPSEAKFLDELYLRLRQKEKVSKVRTGVLLFLITISMSFFSYTFFTERPNMPDPFLLMKYQELLEKHNQPVRDSIDFYLSRMESVDDANRVRALVNTLENNVKITAEKFSGERPFEKNE